MKSRSSVSSPAFARCLIFGFVLWVSAPKSGRAEDSLTFKNQSWQEDDHRIRVDSQYVQIESDLSTTTHVKAMGLIDAIAGATPTGERPATAGAPVPMATMHDRRKAWGRGTLPPVLARECDRGFREQPRERLRLERLVAQHRHRLQREEHQPARRLRAHRRQDQRGETRLDHQAAQDRQRFPRRGEPADRRQHLGDGQHLLRRVARLHERPLQDRLDHEAERRPGLLLHRAGEPPADEGQGERVPRPQPQLRAGPRRAGGLLPVLSRHLRYREPHALAAVDPEAR